MNYEGHQHDDLNFYSICWIVDVGEKSMFQQPTTFLRYHIAVNWIIDLKSIADESFNLDRIVILIDKYDNIYVQ